MRLTRSLAVAGAGLLVGIAVGLVMAVKPLAVALPVAALLVVVPVLLIEDAKLYWLGLFLAAAQFEVAKKLIDGLTVLEAMRIDYRPFVFVPEIRLSDLPFCVLLLMWLNELRTGKARLHVPAVSALALGFLAWAGLSSIRAPSHYMAAVELVRQCKFFLVFLYAANLAATKRTLHWLWILVLGMVVLQGGITIFRFTFNFYEPLFGDLFGRTELTRWMPVSEDEVMLGSLGWLRGLRNSFGTTMSPAVTAQLLLLGLPFAAFACMRNPMFPRGIVRFVPFCVGSIGLALTFSRSSAIGGIVAVVTSFAFGVRAGYLSRRTALTLVLCAMMGVAALLPPLAVYWGRKPENVDIRFEQYASAIAMLRDHPLVGVGPNNSAGQARQYARYSYSLIEPLNRSYDQPTHSFAMTVLVEVGIVGFVLYVGFFGGVAATAWRLVRSRAAPEDVCSAAAFLLGALALGVGVLANPLFDDGVQTFLWFYAGSILAIARSADRPSMALARLRPTFAT